MTSNSTSLYAVITGDIVNSTQLPLPVMQTLSGILRSAGVRWNEVFPDSLVNNVHVFRGDGWQALLRKPALALRFALYLRTHLKAQEEHSIDTRLSVAVGTVDYIPISNNILEATGEAFTQSGHALEQLERGQHMCFTMPSLQYSSCVSLVFQLTDALMRVWTPRQCRAITGALAGYTNYLIAQNLFPGLIGNQIVSNLLWRGNWSVISKALDYFEQCLTETSLDKKGN